MRPARVRFFVLVSLLLGLISSVIAGDFFIKDGDRVVISEKGNVLTFNGQVPKTAEVMQFDAPVPKRKLN